MARDPANHDALANAEGIRQRNAKNEQWSLTPYDDKSYSHVPEFSAFDQNRFYRQLNFGIDQSAVGATKYGKPVQVDDYAPDVWSDRRRALRQIDAKFQELENRNNDAGKRFQFKPREDLSENAKDAEDVYNIQKQNIRTIRNRIKADMNRTDEMEHEYNILQGKVNAGKTLTANQRMTLSRIREFRQNARVQNVQDIEGGAMDNARQARAYRDAFLELDDYQREEVMQRQSNIRLQEEILDEIARQAEEDEIKSQNERRQWKGFTDENRNDGWNLEDEIQIPEQSFDELLDEMDRANNKMVQDDFFRQMDADEWQKNLALEDGEGEETFLDEEGI